MFTNRFFNMIVAAVLMIVVALSVQQAFARKAIVPKTSAVYTESNEQALNEYQLGERYGEIPSDVAQSSAEQILQRHPELIASGETAVDTTDYFFRHLELQGSSIGDRDLTDYFFRHLSD